MKCIGIIGNSHEESQLYEFLTNVGIQVKNSNLGYVICNATEESNNSFEYYDFFTKITIIEPTIKAYIFVPGDLRTLGKMMKELRKLEEGDIDGVPIILSPKEFGLPLINQIKRMINEGFTPATVLEKILVSSDELEIINFISKNIIL